MNHKEQPWFFFQNAEACSYMDAIVVVYSVVDIGSFKLANKVVGEIRKHSQKPVILVANKVDLARGRAVSTKGTLTILFYFQNFFSVLAIFGDFSAILNNFWLSKQNICG